MKKKVIMMLSCIASVAIATVVGKKTYEKNAFEGNALLAQNVEALSQGDTGGGSSECEFGPAIYLEVGSYHGKSTARIHLDNGIDIVYKNVTFTECYAYAANYGEKSGFNGYAEINLGESSYEPCKGWHYFPIN